MLCIFIVFSYFIFVVFLMLRLKFMPRKPEFWAFNTMKLFFFNGQNPLAPSLHLFQLLHNLTNKCAWTLTPVNLPSLLFLESSHFYLYHLYNFMRYSELSFVEGARVQWDLSAKGTQGICDRMVKALPKPHALPRRMSPLSFVRGFSLFLQRAVENQVDIPVYSIWSQLQAQLCLVQKLERNLLCSVVVQEFPAVQEP